MSTETLMVSAVVILAILIVAAVLVSRRQSSATEQRSGRLRDQFGTEYDRMVAEKGDTRSAERELTARQKRVSSFHIRPLEADEGKQFSDEWLAIKSGFVDDPTTAARDTQALVGRVMDARGYPAGDFEQRAADVSVDHPKTLEQHRAAHEIGLRNAEGQANTEDLRQAVLGDHELFSELIGEPEAVLVPAGVATSTGETASDAEVIAETEAPTATE